MGSPVWTKMQNERVRRLLAKNLKLFLAREGITENALAQRCKVSQKQINNIANARTGCSSDVLAEISHVFSVEPWVMLYDGGDSLADDAMRIQSLMAAFNRAGSSDRELLATIAKKVGNSK